MDRSSASSFLIRDHGVLTRLNPMAAALAAGLYVFGGAPSQAATIPVNNNCTLPNAITAANTDAAYGACPAGSGEDTITLPVAAQVLTRVNTNYGGPTGLPVITSDIVITGSSDPRIGSSSITRAPDAPAFRILVVGSSGSLELRNTIVSGGLNDGSPGIANFGGFLKLLNCVVTGNTASSGNGGGLWLGRGGPNSRNLTHVFNSTLMGNSASGNGGAIFNGGAALLLKDSTVDGNSAAAGGGIFSYNGSSQVERSTVSGNHADIGAGIYSKTDQFTGIISSTLSGNSAAVGGGGLANAGGDTLILESTITQNAVTPAQAINGAGVLSVGVSGVSTEVLGSIISNNRAGEGTADVATSASNNSFHSSGNNLIGTGSGTSAFTASGDRTGITNPGLGNLSANGGPTLTHAVLAGSAALDRYACPGGGADQRGVARPQGPACDIGSFERQAVAQLRFSATSATLAESAGVQQITVELTSPATQDVSASLAYSGAARSPADFSAPATVNIPAGSTQTTIPVSIVDDGLDEANEKLVMTLTSISGAEPGSPSQRDLLIQDNDPLPTVTFTQSNTNVSEGIGTTNVVVRLSALSGRSVTVPIGYSGSAIRSSDYTAATSVKIPAGSIQANVAVKVINDTLREGDESIVLTMGTPVNAGKGSLTQRRVTILASD